MSVQAGSPLELAAGWGILQADATVIGLVVAALVIFALVYVVTRVRGGSSDAGNGSKSEKR